MPCCVQFGQPVPVYAMASFDHPKMRTFLAGFALLAGMAHAQAASIGLIAPLSGPSSILGGQMLSGVETAFAALPMGDTTLEIADDGCTADGGRRAASEFVTARVSIVVGFLCTEAIEAALPILKNAGIPTIAVGVRADSLTDRRLRTGWPVFRLGPRSDGEREAAAVILPQLWQDQLFAIVDDGTIYGRELAESVRSAAEQAGLKPVFVDTFRPQLDNQIALVSRLKRAGATHVLAGGDRDDIAVMGRDAAQLEAGLTIAGGETLRAEPGEIPLATGTLMIALPEWTEVADPAIAKAFKEREIQPEGYVLPAFAAVQIAQAALSDPATMARPPAVRLIGKEYATVLGPIRFTERGDVSENPYRLFRFDGSSFVEAE